MPLVLRHGLRGDDLWHYMTGDLDGVDGVPFDDCIVSLRRWGQVDCCSRIRPFSALIEGTARQQHSESRVVNRSECTRTALPECAEMPGVEIRDVDQRPEPMLPPPIVQSKMNPVAVAVSMKAVIDAGSVASGSSSVCTRTITSSSGP